MKKYKVYKYLFPNGKVYIGVTSRTLEERRDFGYSHNLELKAALKQYGWRNIQKEILASDLSEDEAFELEKKSIEAYKATDPSIGYNKSCGGKETYLGLKHNDETKDKIRKANTGRKFSEDHRKNLSKSLKGLLVGEKNPMFGKPKSKETIEKQYKSHECQMRSIVQLDVDGTVVDRYQSINSAARAMGTTKQNIMLCLRKKSKTACGFGWAYEDERG